MTASQSPANVGPDDAGAPATSRIGKANSRDAGLRWVRRVRPYQWVNALIFIGYLAVGIAGITTSNLGSIWNRQNTPGPYPDMIGPAQDLRSDEFWVGTPLSLWYTLGLDDAQVARISAFKVYSFHPATIIKMWW